MPAWLSSAPLTLPPSARQGSSRGIRLRLVHPFFMIMLIENLGRDYIVWDKSASIRFKKPGSGTVSARFRLSQQQVEEIRQAVRF